MLGWSCGADRAGLVVPGWASQPERRGRTSASRSGGVGGGHGRPRREAKPIVTAGAGVYPQLAERVWQPGRPVRALLGAAPCRRELARLRTGSARLRPCSGNTGDPPCRPAGAGQREVVPMTRQGTRPLTEARFWKGVAPRGCQPRTVSHATTTHSACVEKRNDAYVQTHRCTAYKVAKLALTSVNG
jgi:hypothetical protein